MPFTASPGRWPAFMAVAPLVASLALAAGKPARSAGVTPVKIGAPAGSLGLPRMAMLNVSANAGAPSDATALITEQLNAGAPIAIDVRDMLNAGTQTALTLPARNNDVIVVPEGRFPPVPICKTAVVWPTRVEFDVINVEPV